MRFLKPLLVALGAVVAIFAGLLAAVIVVLTTVGFFFARRLVRGRRDTGPTAAPRRKRAADRETIDVVATEIPADRLTR